MTLFENGNATECLRGEICGLGYLGDDCDVSGMDGIDSALSGRSCVSRSGVTWITGISVAEATLLGSFAISSVFGVGL